MPSLHIITGSNGAGKSAIGINYLPLHIQKNCDVFDGDKLFMQKKNEMWNAGSKAIKENKKLAIQFVTNTFETLVDTAINEHKDFAYEGHFTNEETWLVPKRFKENGYDINLIFFGLANTDISELRVINRTKDGGHYVDPQTISDNFYGNLEKLNIHFAMFDTIQIIDTSEMEHKVLCLLKNGEVDSCIENNLLPTWFKNNLPNIFNKIPNM
jgi:predicted ABC-type ATPase